MVIFERIVDARLAVPRCTTNRFDPRTDDDDVDDGQRTSGCRAKRGALERDPSHHIETRPRARVRGAVVGREAIHDGSERVRVDVDVHVRHRARVRLGRLLRRHRASTAANLSPVGARRATDDTAVEIFNHRVGVQAHGIDRVRRGVVTRLRARRVDVLDRRQHRTRRRVRNRGEKRAGFILSERWRSARTTTEETRDRAKRER